MKEPEVDENGEISFNINIVECKSAGFKNDRRYSSWVLI